MGCELGTPNLYSMNIKITKEHIESLIHEACDFLYKQHKNLVDEAANEPSIVASVLVPYLQSKLDEYDVTLGYNREGEFGDRKPKTDLDGNRILPDIIIHKYGPDGPNIAAIEVKGYWNSEDRKEDEHSLQRLEAKHRYLYLFRIELDREWFEVIRVEPI